MVVGVAMVDMVDILDLAPLHHPRDMEAMVAMETVIVPTM